MNFDLLKDFTEKVPFTFLLFVYLAYLGFDLYSFENDLNSIKFQKVKQIETLRDVKSKLDAKSKELAQFVKNIELKKVEIRSLTQQLQDVKGSLSENIDKPAFMKMIGTEALKVGLSVKSSQPGIIKVKEYYAEQSFSFIFKGIFIQTIAFLDRISNVSQIVRADGYSLKSTGKMLSEKYPEIEAEIEFKTYKYIGSKADLFNERVSK